MEIESNSNPLSKSPQFSESTQRTNNKTRNICLSVIAALLLIIIIIVILAFTVFKPEKPEIMINSVKLSDFDIGLNLTRLGVNLNLTLVIALTVKNPNHVGFKYDNSSALLNYHGKLAGEVPLIADKINAGETKAMNLSLVLLANRFISDPSFFKDVMGGSLPLNMFTRISGDVRIIFVNVHVVSSTTCDLGVDVLHRSLRNQTCTYNTKL